MIDAKRIEINGVEYVAVENKNGLCNGCAFKERTAICDMVKCTSYSNENGIETVKSYKYKSINNNQNQ